MEQVFAVESSIMNSFPFPALKLPPLTNTTMVKVRELFTAEYLKSFGQSSGKGFYNNADWRRLDYAAGLIPDGTRSVLDVGVGPGAMLNFLAGSNKYERVTGIDVRRYSKFVALESNLDFHLMDVAKMGFPDNSFDVVLCMEVLEHLEPAHFRKALTELRRVSARRLIMSVPFEEKELPSYHKQRFTREELPLLFPNAEISLLCKPAVDSWPWAFMVEVEPGGAS